MIKAKTYLDGSIIESDTLLHHGSELLDTASTLSEHRLRAAGHGDDLGTSRSTTELRIYNNNSSQICNTASKKS